MANQDLVSLSMFQPPDWVKDLPEEKRNKIYEFVNSRTEEAQTTLLYGPFDAFVGILWDFATLLKETLQEGD